MTVIRHEGQLQVTCDACPHTYRRTYEEQDLQILVEDIKSEGWKIKRQGDVWTHTCSDCAKWADGRLI